MTAIKQLIDKSGVQFVQEEPAWNATITKSSVSGVTITQINMSGYGEYFGKLQFDITATRAVNSVTIATTASTDPLRYGALFGTWNGVGISVAITGHTITLTTTGSITANGIFFVYR